MAMKAGLVAAIAEIRLQCFQVAAAKRRKIGFGQQGKAPGVQARRPEETLPVSVK